MTQKLICLIAAVCILFSSACAKTALEEEIRGVWFSYLEYSSLLQGKDLTAYTAQVKEICKNISQAGFNTVFYQARAFSDAFYPSKLFHWSKYVSGTAGIGPSYDPFAIFIEQAHRQGLKVHAWVNPYRIGDNTNITPDSQAAQWYSSGTGKVLEADGKLYYNPADPEVRAYILDGISEILEQYNVDGIQYDDYFYPTTDPAFDSAFYNGTPDGLAAWRRENVNILIKETYQRVKETDSDLLFGVSPSADIEKNMQSLYADVKTWGKEAGYVDYLAPQIYFGYQNSSMPYKTVLAQWDALCKVPTLLIGLAGYKVGTQDQWAGDGKTEWQQSHDLLSRQYQDAQLCQQFGGVVVFSYTSLFAPDDSVKKAADTECQALSAVFGSQPKQEISIWDSFLWFLQALLPF